MALFFGGNPVGIFQKRNTLKHKSSVLSGDVYFFDGAGTVFINSILTGSTGFLQCDIAAQQMYIWDPIFSVWNFIPITDTEINLLSLYTLLHTLTHTESKDDSVFDQFLRYYPQLPNHPVGFNIPWHSKPSANWIVPAKDSSEFNPLGDPAPTQEDSYTLDHLEKVFKSYGNKDLAELLTTEMKNCANFSGKIPIVRFTSFLKTHLSPEVSTYFIEKAKEK